MAKAKQHPTSVLIYHGGLCAELPDIGYLHFSTDLELAQERAAQWGENGRVLVVELSLDEKGKPADKRFWYAPNMPLVRPPHKQYTYKSGSSEACLEAMKAAISALGESFSIQ